MYLYEVIPLAYIPRPASQVLSYYYPVKLTRFSLVEILLGKKTYPALVAGSENVKDLKLFLRAASFEVKEMKGIITDEPVLFEWQFKLALWMADYYWASLGMIIKKFIPQYIFKNPISYKLQATSSKQIFYLFPDTSYFERVSLPRDYARISSQISEKKEFELFQEIAAGKHRVIAGTKRSLFLPYQGLKEIHIFEEADHNHISWDQRPKYNAVKVAQKLAQFHKAKIIYDSTLSSLQLFYEKCTTSDVQHKDKGARHISLIDLTKETLKTPFSPILIKSLEDCYKANKKVILYINRRGNARFLLCRDCGFTPHCPHCDVSLVFHIFGVSKRTLLCHYCGYREGPPSLCPQCYSYQIKLYGFGSGKVEEEIRILFPKAKIYRLDSDATKIEKEKSSLIEQFSRDGNFLVATSMIFGTTIEPVDMIAALSADNELHIPDFAQSERLFFTLWRLSHLAKKNMYIQTYNPSNVVFTSLVSQNWREFYNEELKIREALNYPPFSSIIKLTYSHKNQQKTRQEAQILAKKLRQQILSYKLQATSYKILGPAPAYLLKLKGKYRYTILLKLQPTTYNLQAHLLSIIPSSWEVEVDPIDSL